MQFDPRDCTTFVCSGASANRATSTKRSDAALPSDAAADPDFGGPSGMAPWQSTESPAFASAYAHRGEYASPQPCRTAESPLGRMSARPGGFVRRDAAAMGAQRRCRTRALSRVRWVFDPRAHRRALCASVKNPSGAPAKCGSGEHRLVAPMPYRRACTIRGCAPFALTKHTRTLFYDKILYVVALVWPCALLVPVDTISICPSTISPKYRSIQRYREK